VVACEPKTDKTNLMYVAGYGKDFRASGETGDPGREFAESDDGAFSKGGSESVGLSAELPADDRR
jgi:hypothetical protein